MRQLRRLRKLRQFTVSATDGDIGSVEEVYFDDQSWVVRYVIVNTGSWLLGRRVLLSPQAMARVEDQPQVIHVNLTTHQVETSPPLESARPISREYEIRYHRHYQWAPYWEPDPLPWTSPGAYPGPPPGLGATPQPPSPLQHPHLRSSEEVTGYAIEAVDGRIGNVEDVIIDDAEWKVRYLEIDTGSWLPGKKVLIAPAWIDSISWTNRSVQVTPLRAVVESAPPYVPSELITPEYEVKLFGHYSQGLTGTAP